MITEDDMILLSAYVDNELEGADLTAFKERLLKEPALRQELDAITENDEMLKTFAGRIDDRAVPRDVQLRIRPGSGRSAIRLFAVAASVFVLTIGSYLLAPSPGADLALLDDLVSGERRTAGEDYLEVIATFRRHDGGYCREIVTRESRQIACLEGTWQTVLEVSRQELPSDSFQPASERDVSAVDDWVSRNMAGAALSLEEERQLIETLSR